jgi:hypothetical protein
MLLATVALVASMAFAGSALAQAPKFHATDSAVNNDGALVASWDERGLGNDNVDYTLTADAEAVFACINRGGNHPEAANKETINAEVSANGSFEPKNGRIQASLTAGPPSAGDFLSGRPAARARQRGVHEHRPHGHEQRSHRDPAGRQPGLLHGLGVASTPG